MRRRCPLLAAALLALSASLAAAQAAEAPTEAFRRGNESATRSRWDDALTEYRQMAGSGARSPSLYWNWAQAASGAGRKGEALWALLRARDLAPSDPSIPREIDRTRAELGLDPSEVSLGLLGDANVQARRFRFDALAAAAFLVSLVLALAGRLRPVLARGAFCAGLLLLLPILAGSFRDPRVVVAQKDAPLLDIPRDDAVALANLREGEVVPLLGEEGDFVRIQDASGARGFAHRSDVRTLQGKPR